MSLVELLSRKIPELRCPKCGSTSLRVKGYIKDHFEADVENEEIASFDTNSDMGIDPIIEITEVECNECGEIIYER